MKAPSRKASGIWHGGELRSPSTHHKWELKSCTKGRFMEVTTEKNLDQTMCRREGNPCKWSFIAGKIMELNEDLFGTYHTYIYII